MAGANRRLLLGTLESLDELDMETPVVDPNKTSGIPAPT
jgi:hypothetical protein